MRKIGSIIYQKQPYYKKLETNAHFRVLIVLSTNTKTGVKQMSHKKIIAENSPIFQYLLKLNFTLYFTIPVLRHIVEFVSASVQKGYNGTVKDIVTLSLANCHRTTFGKF